MKVNCRQDDSPKKHLQTPVTIRQSPIQTPVHSRHPSMKKSRKRGSRSDPMKINTKRKSTSCLPRCSRRLRFNSDNTLSDPTTSSKPSRDTRTSPTTHYKKFSTSPMPSRQSRRHHRTTTVLPVGVRTPTEVRRSSILIDQVTTLHSQVVVEETRAGRSQKERIINRMRYIPCHGLHVQDVYDVIKSGEFLSDTDIQYACENIV